MPIKAILSEDEFGELDTGVQALYRQLDDGNYVADIEDLDSHPSITALRNGHKRSKQERDEARRKAQAFEKRGLGKLLQVSEDLDLNDVDEDRIAQV